jgi:hypothetical protein
MIKNTYEVSLMKILLKSNRHMKYLDKVGRIWSIYDILSTCTASISLWMYFRAIIWTLMLNSMIKMTYKVFLMKLLLKSNWHMKYLDKFDRIWPNYDILPTYKASISFYMYFRVIIWTLMMNSMRKMTYKVSLMKLLRKSNRHMKYFYKFDQIWQIYFILPTYKAPISFYM